MQKAETSWRNDGDWKARYSKLYSSQRISLPQEEDTRRISFMSNDATPYTSLLMRMRASIQASSLCGNVIPSLQCISPKSSDANQFLETFFIRSGSIQSDNLGGNETLLLDMVRARSKELQEESQDHTLELARDDISEDQSIGACVHGLSMHMTERSVSRSRVSRMSTRRDMDIPSILAFTATTAPVPAHLEIAAFQKVNTKPKEEIPRWSIRRSVCPVCSQKWKDRSSVNNIKYSGLKRNSSTELPSIIAPARLRTSVTTAYVPRPALAMVHEELGSMRNTSAAWQLTRARRFRLPKPQMPPPEAKAPPSVTAPLARRDLHLRVTRFLNNKS